MLRPTLRAIGARTPRSPAREALAAAIAELAEFDAALAATRAAHAAAEAAALTALVGLPTVEAAVPEIQAAATAHAIAVARGTATGPAPSVAAARAAVQAAQDDLAAAQAAGHALAAEVADRVLRRVSLDQRVEKAAKAVLAEAPGVARIVREIGELQRRLVDCGEALAWLALRGVVPTGEIPPATEYAPRTYAPGRLLNERYFLPPASWTELIKGANAVPGAGPWVAALRALEIDADAALPE